MSTIPGRDHGSPRVDEQVGRQTRDDTIARFQALPPDRFPHLIEITTAATASDAETEFRASLSLLIDGLRADAVPQV